MVCSSTCMHLELISIGVCSLWTMRGWLPYPLGGSALHIRRQSMHSALYRNENPRAPFSKID